MHAPTQQAKPTPRDLLLTPGAVPATTVSQFVRKGAAKHQPHRPQTVVMVNVPNWEVQTCPLKHPAHNNDTFGMSPHTHTHVVMLNLTPCTRFATGVQISSEAGREACKSSTRNTSSLANSAGLGRGHYSFLTHWWPVEQKLLLCVLVKCCWAWALKWRHCVKVITKYRCPI